MSMGSFITRLFFALWLCVGAQLHVAVDHAAALGHASHHLFETHQQAAPSVAFVSHDDTLCCYHTPAHQHHDDGAPHAHFGEALLVPSTQRPLQALHVAILPIRLMEALQESAPVRPEIQAETAPTTPYLRLATLRGPPVA